MEEAKNIFEDKIMMMLEGIAARHPEFLNAVILYMILQE